MLNLIKITEIKNGSNNPVTYEIEAKRFVSLVKNKDESGELEIGVEPILDQDGEVDGYTPDAFWELPLSRQIDMCCEREAEAKAASVTWQEVA